MKITKLLVLSALWLIGLGANAADLIERTAPAEPSWVIDIAAIDPTPCEFKAGDVYVLYNVGAEMFYYHGNAWGSQASGSVESAIPVRFMIPEGKTLADKQLYLRNFDDRSGENKWRTAFVAIDGHVGGVYGTGTPAVFIDNNDGTAALMWVEAAGDKIYHISISEDNTNAKPEGLFFGIDPDGLPVDGGVAGTCIMPKLAAGTNTEWQFFAAPAEMGEYYKAYDVYSASQNLKKEIATAEALGADVSAAVAVYNNESATLEQINAAITALKESMSSSYTSGTGKDPKDASFLLTNPTFDTIGDFHGWSGTAFGAGGTKSTNAEWYQAAQGADAYQDLSGLAPGYYIAGVKGFYRAGSTDDSYKHFKAQDESTKSVQFYVKANEQTYETNICSNFQGAPTNNPSVNGQTSATDSETGITYYVPNTMESSEVYMHKYGLYDNFMFVQVGEDKAMRIGVKKSGEQLGSDWAIFDDFTLTYVGTNPNDRFPGLAWKQLQNYPNYDGDIVTPEVLQAYQAVKDNDDLRMAVTDEASYKSFMAQIDAAKAAVDENVALWKTWAEKVEEAKTLLGNPNIPEAFLSDLGDYVDFELEGIIEDGYILTSEEIAAEIQQLSDWIEIANLNVAPGTDVTATYLVNASFEEGNKGWQGAGSVTAFANGEVEAYERNPFDLYQEISKAPKGVYSITLQGFYRNGGNDAAYKEYKELKQSGQKIPEVAWVYLNDNKTPLLTVYDIQGDERIAGDRAQSDTPASTFYVTENGPAAWAGTDDDGNVWSFPNGMGSAHDCFEAGMYQSTAYGLVVNNGDPIRIGIKGNLGSYQWAIWDNFKLVYEGFTASVVQPVLKQIIGTAEENLEKKMDKDVLAALQAAVAEGKAVENSEDGEEMFKALAAISAIKAAESIEKFTALENANDELANAYLTAECDKATILEAQQLYNAIASGLENNEFTNDDVDAKLAEITAMRAKLRIPAGMDTGSDDNPFDCTSMIVNPDYTYGNNDGWTITGGSPGFNTEWGLIEAYNFNFDEYQELEGLPEGTYELSLQGFYRFGGAAKEYETYTADPSANNNLLLYTKVGEVESSVAMPRLASDGAEEHTSALFEVDENGEPKLNEEGQLNFIAGDDIDDEGSRWHWTWITDPVANEDNTAATGVRLVNGTITAGMLFQAGKFAGTSVIFKVGAEGKARIGLKKTVQEDTNWCIWDNWKLVYYGKNSTKEPTIDGIETSVSDAAVVKTEFFDLSGALIGTPKKGVAIMKQTLADGTIKVQKVIIK